MIRDDRPNDAASLVRFMAEMEGYLDKEIKRPMTDDAMDDVCKAIVVAFVPGDRVRLAGGEPGEWGFVTAVTARMDGAAYQVSWPASKTFTCHYDFELEDAE